MEMRMPSGALLSEEFDSAEALFKRFGELSTKGGKVERMHIPKALAPTEARYEPFKDFSKYPAHQGKREVERRLAQLERAMVADGVCPTPETTSRRVEIKRD